MLIWWIWYGRLKRSQEINKFTRKDLRYCELFMDKFAIIFIFLVASSTISISLPVYQNGSSIWTLKMWLWKIRIDEIRFLNFGQFDLASYLQMSERSNTKRHVKFVRTVSVDQKQLKHNKILKTRLNACVSVLLCRKELMLIKIQTENGDSW